MVISLEQKKKYEQEGFLVIRDFYDKGKEIVPMQSDIRSLLNLLTPKRVLQTSEFDEGLSELLKTDREKVSRLYDAVKKTKGFTDFALSEKHWRTAQELLGSFSVGVAIRGLGIRMDNPFEDEFLTQWHQDYTSQICSPSAVVFWTPLRDTSKELGSVELLIGSHREGILNIVKEKSTSRGLLIRDEDEIVKKYASVTPLLSVGDVLITNFLTVHRSLPNVSSQTRWSAMARFFDFLEPIGISHGWQGGLQEGNSFEKIHPELTDIHENTS